MFLLSTKLYFLAFKHYINCYPFPFVMDTLGHGRSACVVCAVLVALGVAETWKDAENIVRERRKIKMNALHRKTLEEWSKHRAAQKKGN